jgi:signal transduction histidine kinase
VKSTRRRRKRARDRLDPQRALQLGFVALLAICAAQVVWWIYDEVVYTRRIQAEILSHHRADLQAARMMMERGVSREVVLSLFDELVATGDGSLAISPQVSAALEEEQFDRLNRYVWEGGFFLLVLAAGVTVLTRAMHQDTALRRRQQNFVAAVSHELKSPVASMRLAAETLLFRDPPAESRQRVLGRLVQDIDRLETMVSNILDTARIEEGELAHDPQRLCLLAVAESVAEEMVARVRDAEIELEVQGSRDAVVEIDEVALRSVLRNLLDNALKATEAQAGSRIVVEVAREGDEARLTVRDDGKGFPPEQAEALFEKFYRPGDEMQRPSRGSGLGLYLVRRLVKLYGGSIAATSAGPGRGASFTIRWPLAGGDE